MQPQKLEIERKFLIKKKTWTKGVTDSLRIVQGYLPSKAGCKGIRVRIMGGRGFLTLKGKRTGISCEELETEIPVSMAESLLCSAETIIEKTRHLVPIGDLVWEIDVFKGPREGLVIAEVELEHEDQYVDLPSWVGKEVSSDKAYSNRNLSWPQG